jgi:uncharacterized membrane protein YhaH (DUF805 family)
LSVEIPLWIAQALLATVFLVTGTIKLTQAGEAVGAGPVPWVADITGTRFRAIGVLEVVGAMRLVVPGLLHVATGLTPTAAAGVAVAMGAMTVKRLRDRDARRTVVPIVLLALAVFVAVARFGTYSL